MLASLSSGPIFGEGGVISRWKPAFQKSLGFYLTVCLFPLQRLLQCWGKGKETRTKWKNRNDRGSAGDDGKGEKVGGRCPFSSLLSFSLPSVPGVLSFLSPGSCTHKFFLSQVPSLYEKTKRGVCGGERRYIVTEIFWCIQECQYETRNKPYSRSNQNYSNRN